ncbi:amidohydrolase [Paenibacillus sp. F411]|uniref:Amidohydrolase n=1 Tax=Paenibacillus algicola TaxID=2565926 RepID=A0A4P8XID2_9BACL|nr:MULTISPECIES: M20 family metallopeptidase [Paenibacillus]MBO2944953.1 amidohydrolase [Paenibacillus sp. F411]QCT02346.1 amidohydrolase [Paenibacillus algicola]
MIRTEQAEALFPRMVEWRRYLHRFPEVSYQEEKTAQFVASVLEALGYEPRTGMGGHGVMAVLKGGRPGRTIVLRADMDALPIQDEKECQYKSAVEGVMHACGHDGHTSMLLAAAAYFKSMEDQVRGEIRFLFQPAEEVCPGGALGMIEAGALKGADVIYGLHLWTPLPVGMASSAAGPLMAAADEFFIDMVGRGGHGGMPHVTADAVLAGATLVTQLQSIVSRSVDPLQPAVVTIGTIQGGSAQNVVADRCRITGTVRTFDEETRLLIRSRIERIAHAVADSSDTTAVIDYLIGYPAVINDELETQRFFKTAPQVFGGEQVLLTPPIMPAEDFAYYLQQIPGCFMFVGAGNEAKGAVYPHHHPRFDFDEDAMLLGLKLLIQMTEAYQDEHEGTEGSAN